MTPGIMLATAVLVAVVEFVVAEVAARVEVDSLVLVGGARVIQAVFILVLVWRSQGLDSIGLYHAGLAKDVLRGILWSLGFGVLVGCAALVLWLHGVNPVALIGSAGPAKFGWEMVLFLAVGCLLAPLVEEIVYRGVLFEFLRRWGTAVAVIASTLLFALSHGLQGGLPLMQGVGGLLFALAYAREGRLVVPMVIHVAGNTAIYAVSLVGGA